MGNKKRKFSEESKEDNEFDLPSKHLPLDSLKEKGKRLIVVLEGAQLESIAVSIT